MKQHVLFWHTDTRESARISEFLRERRILVHVLESEQALLVAASRTREAALALLGSGKGPHTGIVKACERVKTQSFKVIALTEERDDRALQSLYYAGADLCLHKPFSLEVLYSIIHSMLNRYRDEGGREFLLSDNVAVYPSQRQVRVKDKPLELRQREYSILETLARKKGHVVKRSDILEQGEDTVSEGAIDVHICNLRKKLRSTGIVNELIHTVPGYGYIIR